MSISQWGPDRFLDGFQSRSWVLEKADPVEGEPADAIFMATLVRRQPPRHQRAVCYVHGWNDYFFQRHLADFWDKQGFDFYAVDLRRYGRNLRPGMFAGYVTNLHHYADELDGAFDLIADDGHDLITLHGHSTGGLICAVWANSTERQINGVVLNSPWIDMQIGQSTQWAWAPLISGMAVVKPTTPLAIPESGLYWKSISDLEYGEWSIDPDYKSNAAFLVRFGWARAILAAQGEVDQGMSIATPVLSMMSTRSNLTARTWDESLKSYDLVLDADRLAAVSYKLGPNVTIARIENAMHDLILSPHPVRDEAFAQMARWLKVYVR